MKRGLLGAFLILPALHAQFSTTLKPEAASKFDSYVRTVEAELDRRAKNGATFLWVDERKDLVQKVQSGEVVVDRRGPRPHLDSAMVHDWTAAALVRGATIARVLAVLQDYEQHARIYPEVVSGKVLSRNGNELRPFLRLRKKKVITVILNSEYRVQRFDIAPNRARMNSYSTKITEVEDPGTPQERELPPDTGNGFLWRLHAFWSLEQRPEGVMVECRAVSLSRSVPFGLGTIIGPIVESLPRESLIATLEATRSEVEKRK